MNQISPKKLFILLLLNSLFFSCSPPPRQHDGPPPPDGYWNELMVMAAWKMGTLDLIEKKPEVPEDIAEHKDLLYRTTSTKDLKLDIYHKKDINGSAPLLVFIHGGGWTGGDKRDYLVYLLDFAKLGYVTATLSYRFAQEAKFPAAVIDVKCAIKWLKTHAGEYHIDPEKIAVIGGSAGGHLSMMIGYSSDVPELDGDCPNDSTSSRVQAVVNFYGPTDLTTEYGRNHSITKNFLGKTWEEDPDIFRHASPDHYLTADDPPTLIFHGTIDSLVPVSQSDNLKARLDSLGVDTYYHRLKGWPHTMDAAVEVNEYCQYYMREFFQKYLPLGGVQGVR
ncbi:MAG: alpha/beta hydrolase [Cyclobacteriaceae bacterium]|nr:alpha/beta hydrolase [Cyclobacteriaceae bacterium]